MGELSSELVTSFPQMHTLIALRERLGGAHLNHYALEVCKRLVHPDLILCGQRGEVLVRVR
jgi:hypothetical protein